MENQVFIDAKVVNAFFTGDEATRTALSKIYPELDFGKQNEAIKNEVASKSGAIVADLRKYLTSEDLSEKNSIQDRNAIDFKAIYNEVFVSMLKRSVNTEFEFNGIHYRLIDVNKYRFSGMI